MIKRFIIFLVLNFAALGLGSMFTNAGVTSEWYNDLNKAPWTPPGWAFGAAWTTIMICFSFYMAYLWPKIENKKSLIILYVIQWILNVSWNPAFFHFRHVTIGMFIISLLTILVGYLLIRYSKKLGNKSALLLPYILWLLIATSLNGYILIYN